jgi:hypothetical protein
MVYLDLDLMDLLTQSPVSAEILRVFYSVSAEILRVFYS